MTNLKQSRWTKVNAFGNEVEAQDNILVITVGEASCTAEVHYSTSLVKSLKKAAYWLLRSLEKANAVDVIQKAADEISCKVENSDTDQLTVSGDGWECKLEKIAKGEFNARLTWMIGSEAKQLTLLEDSTVDYEKMTVKQLKAIAKSMGVSTKGLKKKSDYIAAIA